MESEAYMKKSILGEIVMFICIFLIGLALVLWADKVTNVVSIVLGFIAIIYGLVGLVEYFKTEERGVRDNIVLIYITTLLVVGGILIFKVDFLKELVSLIIGVYILISSIIRLGECITLSKSLNTKLTGSTILSIVGILIGIMLIVGKFIFPDIIVTYVGIMLIVYSIISIINVILLNRK